MDRLDGIVGVTGWLRRVWTAVVLVILLVRAGIVLAKEPPSEPLLRIENGMHTARITGISTDKTRALLLTVSIDKTARLWSLHDGKQTSVLRPPIGHGDEGKLYAGALSPDGTTAAVAGATGYEWDHSYCVYLFDARTGRLARRLTGLPEVVHALAFSPDGKRFGAGLGRSGGVRVWRTDDWSEAWSDRDYREAVYGLTFDATGQVVTSSFDGNLRSYDASGRFQRSTKAPGGSRPYGVAIAPDGGRVAVGYEDASRVDVMSLPDLQLRATPDARGIDASLGIVAWSTGGCELFAAGNGRNNTGQTFIRAWPICRQGPYRDSAVARNAVTGLMSLSRSEVVFATADPAWGVLRGTRLVDQLHTAEAVDLTEAVNRLWLTTDGKTVHIGLPHGQTRTFSLAKRLGIGALADAQEATGPKVAGPGMEVRGWRNSPHPTLNQKNLKLEEHEVARAVAVSSERLLLGTDWSLRLFDRTGSQLWSQDVPAATRAVNVRQDGQVAVAAFGDGTIRWYRMKDGAELLAAFPHLDGRHWVAWTPDGYYDASAGGDELLVWHVNRQADKEADVFGFDKFPQYNRQDVIERVLDAMDVHEAVRLANNDAGRSAPAPVAQLLPPVVMIVSPLPNDPPPQVTRTPVDVTFVATSRDPVTGVQVRVDGTPVSVTPPKESNGVTETVATVTVPVPEHDASISITATNVHGTSKPGDLKVAWHDQAGVSHSASEDVTKPVLYVVAIGVAHYSDARMRLTYAARDATEFAVSMRAQKGGLYRDVVVTELVEENATHDHIRVALDSLREATPRDVVIVFLSGHGLNDTSRRYSYAPFDYDQSRPYLTSFTESEAKEFIDRVEGKVIVFLDTCWAGAFEGKAIDKPNTDRLANLLASEAREVVVFASSTGQQESLEEEEWGHGAFTKALLEAIQGKADYNNTGTISFNILDRYLSERVRDLTGQQQSPTYTNRSKRDLVFLNVIP